MHQAVIRTNRLQALCSFVSISTETKTRLNPFARSWFYNATAVRGPSVPVRGKIPLCILAMFHIVRKVWWTFLGGNCVLKAGNFLFFLVQNVSECVVKCVRAKPVLHNLYFWWLLQSHSVNYANHQHSPFARRRHDVANSIFPGIVW